MERTIYKEIKRKKGFRKAKKHPKVVAHIQPQGFSRGVELHISVPMIQKLCCRRITLTLKFILNRFALPILTFIIEAVYSVNASTFMVSSQKKEVFWIFDLIG